MKRFAAYLITLMLLLAGFWMPRAVSAAADRRLENSVELCDFDNVQLTVARAGDAAQQMAALTGDYNSVRLGAGEKMTEQTAFDAAQTLLRQFEEKDLTPPAKSYVCVSALPMLAVPNRNASASVLTWMCELTNADGWQFYLQMSDEGGALLSATIFPGAEQFLAETTVARASGDLSDAMLWAQAIAEVNSIPCTNVEAAETSDGLYQLTFESGEGEARVSVKMSLRLQDFQIDFNS